MKILVIKGNSQYDVLRYFIDAIEDGFRSLGAEVVEFDVLKGEKIRYLTRFSNADFIFNFNAGLIEPFEIFFKDSNTPVWSFLVDHPLSHHARMLSMYPKHIVSCIDKKHVEYLKNHYPNIDACFFVPHGGNEPLGEVKAYGERTREVSFFGTYAAGSSMEKQMNSLGKDTKELLIRAVKTCESSLNCTMEEAVRLELDKLQIVCTNEQFADYMCAAEIADDYYRSRKRERLVRGLMENGITVDVYGNGWDQFPGIDRRYLHVHPSVSYEEVLDIMCDSKVVLNILPLFRDGSHERIFSAMLCGAVCITDVNQFLEEHFENGKELFWYDGRDEQALADCVAAVLQNPQMAEAVSKEGRQKALENHTWNNVAKTILEYFQTISVENEEQYIVGTGIRDNHMNQMVNYWLQTPTNLLLAKIKACYNREKLKSPERYEKKYKALHASGLWNADDITGDVFFKKIVSELKENLSEYVWLYNRLEDYRSKEIMTALFQFWEFGDNYGISMLSESREGAYEEPDIIRWQAGDVLVNLQTTEDSLIENCIFETHAEFGTIYNLIFREALYREANQKYSGDGRIQLFSCNPQIMSALKLDELIPEPIDVLKIEAYGKEEKILEGSQEHIEKNHPCIMVDVGNKLENLWRIPNLLDQINENYSFYLRYYGGDVIPGKYVLFATERNGKRH